MKIIQSSNSTLEERTKLVQDLYNQVSPQSATELCEVAGRIQPSVRADGSSGCEHYSSKCVIWCDTCAAWFPCRRCHDDQVPGHPLIRQHITRVGCTVCRTAQSCQRACIKCGTTFARYFCETCRLYDDSGAPVYHCTHCGVCRRGKGLGIDYEHCPKCNACYSIAFFAEHTCREDVLHHDCPICQGFLFDSPHPITFVIPCRHALHQSCLVAHLKFSSSCPLCSTSIRDLSDKFAAMDEQFEKFNSAGFVLVRCNDCGQRCVADRRGKMAKCEICWSYNTNILQSVASDEVGAHACTLTNDQIRDIRLKSIHQQRFRSIGIWETGALGAGEIVSSVEPGSDLENEFLTEALGDDNWEVVDSQAT